VLRNDVVDDLLLHSIDEKVNGLRSPFDYSIV
jgi:hypothetical protein